VKDRLALYAQWDKILAAGGSIAVTESDRVNLLVSCASTEVATQEAAWFTEQARSGVSYIEGCELDESLIADEPYEVELDPPPPSAPVDTDLYLHRRDPDIYAHQVDDVIWYGSPPQSVARLDEFTGQKMDVDPTPTPQAVHFAEGVVQVTPRSHWVASEDREPHTPVRQSARYGSIAASRTDGSDPFLKGGLVIELYIRSPDNVISAFIQDQCRLVSISSYWLKYLLHRPLRYEDLKLAKWKRRICIYHQDGLFLAGQVRAAYARLIEKSVLAPHTLP